MNEIILILSFFMFLGNVFDTIKSDIPDDGRPVLPNTIAWLGVFFISLSIYTGT